jgi:cytochrome c oxidase subunit 3
VVKEHTLTLKQLKKEKANKMIIIKSILGFKKVSKYSLVLKNTLLFREQLKHLIKTTHLFHLVDPSPWPFIASFGACAVTTGFALYLHKYAGGWGLFLKGILIILLVMFTWWRDVIREATFENKHTAVVQKGLRLGMLLFIVSEIMFFFAFFWAFFHSSIAPVYNIGAVWPPKAISVINTFTIPLTNTIFLLTSGSFLTYAHQALVVRAKKHSLFGLLMTLILAVFFTCFQLYEYLTAPFNISDGIYGSCFYMTTGFHGFHVLIGTVALFVSLVRLSMNHYTTTRHFGFEAAIWYWHFVDIVWLLVYISIYWWGNKVIESNF